jgi:hypothetical protein
VIWNGEDGEVTIRGRELKAGNLPRGKARRKILRWMEENEIELMKCWDDATTARSKPNYLGEC